MEETEIAVTETLDGINAVFAKYWENIIAFLPRLFVGLVVFLVVLLLTVLITKFVNRRIVAKAEDPLLGVFITRFVKGILIVIGALLALHAMGFTMIAGSLLAGAGVGAFVIGFAFKDIGENFLSGIILAFNRPFHLNDTVQIGGFTGDIVSMHIRNTHIRTPDGKDIYIPNSIIVKDVVINFTRDGLLRKDFVIGIDPNEDTAAAIELILKTVKDIKGVLDEPEPVVMIDAFGVNSIDLRVYYWINTFIHEISPLVIQNDIMLKVKNTLIANSFSMPSNIQEIKMYDYSKALRVVTKDISQKAGDVKEEKE